MRLIKQLAKKLVIEGVISPALRADIKKDQRFAKILKTCQPFTMTSPERLFGLYSAVQYVMARGLPGDFVECGVWRGGSTIATALAFEEAGDDQRQFWL